MNYKFNKNNMKLSDGISIMKELNTNAKNKNYFLNDESEIDVKKLRLVFDALSDDVDRCAVGNKDAGRRFRNGTIALEKQFLLLRGISTKRVLI